jgi:hypothetical protein
MRANKRADMGPVILEDLVKFGQDRAALATGRQFLIDVLAVRGLVPTKGELKLIERESDLLRLRTWVRGAVTAKSVAEAIAG